jgi:Ca2+-binding EF-hand superfamily protein
MSTAQNLMNWQDKDKDGRVSWTEFLGSAVIFGQTPAEAEEAFRHLDRDADGYLNTDEWLRNTEEFFMSDDPKAPGNWLLGPF